MINKSKTIKEKLLFPVRMIVRFMLKMGHAIKHMSIHDIIHATSKVGEAVVKFVYGTGLFVENTVIAFVKFIYRLLLLFIGFTYKTGEFVIKYSKFILKHGIKLIMLIPKSFIRDFSYWAPSLSAIGVIALLLSTNFYTLALKVTVNGKDVGYVSNESEFTSLVSTVEDQLGNSIGENYVMKTSPEYSFAVVDKSKVASEEMYDDVYSAVCEEIGEHYGLYVDGKLIAATETKDTLSTILEELKEPHKTGEKNESVEFVANVEIRKGIFAPSYFIDENAIRAMFSASTNPRYYIIQENDYLSDICKATGLTRSQIYSLNPDLDDRRLIPGKKINISQPDVYLGIKIIKTISYTEEIDYETVKIKDDSLYQTQTKVKKSGSKGEKSITAEVTYVDGAQVSKKIVSEKVTREPVEKEIYVGTKSLPTSSSPLAGTGTFIRPINGGYTSCSYGGYRGHRGVDLTMRGAYGKAVYASASGTVISAGWSGGLGKCVVIRHSNGYTTTYAHMSSYTVSPGQSVYQGQQVGRIGSTGNSTGPHLHFELRINGSAVNPMNYIG